MAGASSNKVFFRQLSRYYTFYTGGFIAFVVLVGILEQLGSPDRSIRYAARIAMESQPVTDWQDRALALEQPAAAL